MYNIKFGEHTLQILNNISSFSFEKIGKNKAVVYQYTKRKKLMELVHEIENSPIKYHIVFHPEPEIVFEELSKILKPIKAGGGLVVNEKQQILFIFRNGKWDLPKGKIEVNESTELGAVREVEEECGIKISMIDKLLDITYHTYEQDGKSILKSNYWYLMHADSSQELKPQTEENIEKVEWVERDNVKSLLTNSYESIVDLINNFI
jgi:8-oxo-dGTP pyrophosphatase MutT (NUDIX family)